MHRLQMENKELEKRIRYTAKLEERQQQLLKENAEYREKVELMKAKFKEAAPGLAKSGRISQKMMRENADMHYNLGTIFLHNKQYREAIKEYEQVLELRPSDPETHYNLGILYDDYLKDRQKALYHYQKYLAINPKAPDAKKVETYVLSLELEQKVR
jgi:tetratricopeptide (TPR) repeat protein